MTDPQVQRVYTMEAEEFGSHTHAVLPLKRIRSYIRQTCTEFAVPQAKFRIRKKRGCGGSWRIGSIQLCPKNGRNALTVMHELTHHILAYRHPRAQDHGPTFCAYYSYLLDAWRIVPIAGFKVAARKYQVKVGKRPIP